MASGLRALGLPIGPVVTMDRSGKGSAREALKRVQGTDKVKGQRVCVWGGMGTFDDVWFVFQWSSCA